MTNKQLVKLALGAGLAWMAHADVAMAACSTSRSTNSYLNLPSSLSAKRDVTVGTVLYDSGWVSDGTRADVFCSGSYTWNMGYASTMTLVPGMSDVYQTGVPGLGIKILYENTSPPGSGMVMRWPRFTQNLSGNARFVPWGLFRVQYIVTGPLGSGQMNTPSPTATVLYGGALANRVTFNRTSVNIVSVGCSVTNKDIAVNLPPVAASDFATVGSTPATKDFTIDLTCDTNVAVSYQIDGTAAAGIAPTNGVLATTAGAGQATGVGVQVRRNGTPVPLGTKLSYATTTGGSAQSVSIPLSAAYYATAMPVRGGDVNAVATFTMFYQ
ncbi:fimbrial protein [Lysobacter arvi]|uniref:Fimbrial protein n=1 Tax=Lysobacter arvi TaxID=3038776 RepID=A0ABU1CGE3_9GAMM|nr:fimbrial protein [Lysobacter arvi]MDR0184015.1 fimbrial protein [Lysobacter arvi]